jgi:hypothetical protein
MIKSSLTAILILLGAYCSSQENKGNFVVNAAINLSLKNQPVTTGGIYLGYFVTDHFSFGITCHQSHERNTLHENAIWQDYSSEIVKTEHFSGVFARYNHLFQGKFGFFLSLNPSYIRRKDVTTQTTYYAVGEYTEKTTYRYNGIFVSLDPGIIYFINKRFSLETKLGSIYYLNTFSKNTNYEINEKHSDFDLSFFTTNLNLGVSFYFARKKEEDKKNTNN